ISNFLHYWSCFIVWNQKGSNRGCRMRELLLLRGLPGSGKSSLAEILSEKGKHPQYSIDDYFINSRGEYVFEFDKNHLAYKECQKKVEESMNSEAPFIIVHNVFSMEWEWEPYFK